MVVVVVLVVVVAAVVVVVIVVDLLGNCLILVELLYKRHHGWRGMSQQ